MAATIFGSTRNDVISPGMGYYLRGSKTVALPSPDDQGTDSRSYTDYFRDEVFGGAGDDWIHGGLGEDTLHGEAGDDTLLGGDGYDWLHGGAGGDELQGGAHRDVASYADAVAGVLVDLNNGYAIDAYLGKNGKPYSSRDTLVQAGDNRIEGAEGSEFADVLIGDHFGSHLMGRGGADSLQGADGVDLLEGGEGQDSLYGGAGDDILDGGSGHDSLDGGAGNDRLAAGDGDDVLRAGEGVDTLLAGPGDDRLFAEQTSSGETIFDGGDGYDTLHLEDSPSYYDTFVFGENLVAVEALALAGSSTKWVTILDAAVAAGCTLTLDNELDGSAALWFDGTAEVDGSFVVLPGDGNDSLQGGAGNDVFWGGAGADVFTFWRCTRPDGPTDWGLDLLEDFDASTDTMSVAGEANSFWFDAARGCLIDTGSAGTPEEFGVRFGEQADRPDRVAFDGTEVEFYMNPTGGQLRSGSSTFAGTDGGDLLILFPANAPVSFAREGPAGAESDAAMAVVSGGAGDDWILAIADPEFGPAGQEVQGGDGDDTVIGGQTLEGGTGDDLLCAGASIYAIPITLDGGKGIDTLQGGAGDDVLHGGADGDVLAGGPGSDLFWYSEWSDSVPTFPDRDSIEDFVQHADRIDLSAVEHEGGDAPLEFIGGASFDGSVSVGQVRWYWLGESRDYTYVEADFDGDGVGEFEVVLTGSLDLKEGDFVL